MKKWEHLELDLFGNKALMYDLGQINVICGKNNSGKSTILKILSDEEQLSKKYLNLFKIDIKLINSLNYEEGDPESSINKDGSSQTNWAGGLTPEESDLMNEAKRCFLAFEKTAVGNFSTYKQLKKAIIEFNKEAQILYNEKYQEDDGSFVLIPRTEGLNKILEDYIYNFHKNIKTLFIETQREILPKQNLREAKGALKKLFYAKNSKNGSPSFKKYKEIQSTFTRISGGYSFDIELELKTNKEYISLSFAYKNLDWYNASDSGLGLRALLVLIYAAVLSDTDIILIDEPESYLHPSWQRELLKYFKNDTNKQFFIATHSNIFLDTNYVDKIFQVKYSNKIEVSDIQDKALALADLGYLSIDNLQGDLLILVEGKTDVTVLKEYLRTLGIWNKYDIKIFPCGGVSGIESMPLEILKKDYHTVVVLMDGDWKTDKGLEKSKEKIEAECNRLYILFHALEGYGIENYFTLRVLKEYTGKTKPITHKQLTKDQLYINKKVKIKNITFIKNKNVLEFGKVAKKMTSEEINKTDDLSLFIDQLISICKTIPSTY